MSLWGFGKTSMVAAGEALPGRDEAMAVPARHEVLDAPLAGPFLEGVEAALFGMGCFWGAERRFWQMPGVYSTAVGYGGGYTPNPHYEEVCSGCTGHAELVLVAFRPAELSYDALLKSFWEGHDPTQGLRQGNDVGSQYRSMILCFTPGQRARAEASREAFQARLNAAGLGNITTEIRDVASVPGAPFYYAEPGHQQYLAKNPGGYCGLGGTGVRLD